MFLALGLAAVLEAVGLDVSRMLVRAWVWLYTVPVPCDARERRREELAEHLATERGDPSSPEPQTQRREPPMGRGVRTMFRLVKGMWSDLAWAAQTTLGPSARS